MNTPPRIMTPKQAECHERFVHHRDIALNAIRAGCTDALVILAHRETDDISILTIGKFIPTVLSEAMTVSGKLQGIVFMACQMPFEMQREHRLRRQQVQKDAEEGRNGKTG